MKALLCSSQIPLLSEFIRLHSTAGREAEGWPSTVTVLCCDSGLPTSHVDRRIVPASCCLWSPAQGNTEVGYSLITLSRLSLLHAISFSKSCDRILEIERVFYCPAVDFFVLCPSAEVSCYSEVM